MATKFSGASMSETGGINGAKGDSTGKEVRTCDAYNHKLGWRVFRHPDATIAKWVGANAKAMADNNCFGYGQSDRETGYTAAKNAGWEPKNVKTKCNVDCSSLVRTCIACAKEKEVPNFNTSTEASILLKEGFNEVTNWSLSTLRVGDVLVTKTKGHTEVVSEGVSPSVTTPVTTTTTKKYYDKYTGLSTSITTALKAVGETDVSLTHRKKIAVTNAIVTTNAQYTGTATQNNKMMALLKAGKLLKA